MIALFLLSSLVFAPSAARADVYWGSYFNDYRPHEEPIISIDMNPQDSLDSSMRIAAREDRIEDLEKAVQDGANVNSRSDVGETALMYASRNCAPRIASFLIRGGARLNLRDRYGRTALMYAAMESCVPVTRILLQFSHLEIDARDKEGRSALDYARDGEDEEVGGPSTEIARLISEHGLRRPMRRFSKRSTVPSRAASLSR